MIGFNRPPSPPGGGVISVNTAGDSPPTPLTTNTIRISTSQVRPKPAAPIDKRGRQEVAAFAGDAYRGVAATFDTTQFPAFFSIRISISLAAASTMKVMKNRIRPRATSDEV